MTANPGDVVTIDFPGITGIKRRPAVVLSSDDYHAARPDVIVGLITSQLKGLGKTDYVLKGWKEAGLRKVSVFRSFIVTLPPSANLIRVGHLTEDDWKEVCKRLTISLAGIDSV